MNPDTKRFFATQMMWIGVSLGISFALSMILPFPVSVIAMIGLFVFMSYVIRKRQMRKMGLTGSGFSAFGLSKGMSYHCMNCGTKHNQASCPRCGSKLKKADF
jgi:apolipoprotein N-acyltransferase